MEHKSNKELAVEATIEYVKSWNSNSHNACIEPNEFTDILKNVYSTICSLEED